MEVRDATVSDLEGVLAIVNQEIREGEAHFGSREHGVTELEAWLDDQGRLPFVVAVEGEGVLGYARAMRWKGREAYDWTVEVGVYVQANAQGRGVGRALYRALFPKVMGLGFRTLLAGIALPNPASVRLHEAMGMTRAGLLPCVGYKHGRWIDVGYWVLCVGEGPPEDVRPDETKSPAG